jgi:hypothetical protein
MHTVFGYGSGLQAALAFIILLIPTLRGQIPSKVLGLTRPKQSPNYTQDHDHRFIMMRESDGAAFCCSPPLYPPFCVLSSFLLYPDEVILKMHRLIRTADFRSGSDVVSLRIALLTVKD